MMVAPLSLFASGDPMVDRACSFVRHQLDPCCWVEVGERFLAGADALLADLDGRFPWVRGRRLMYGTWHDEPRLTARLDPADPVVPEVVVAAIGALSDHFGRPFDGLFCNYYQDGSDSVAWHADRIGRTTVDPLVAIISLGGPRTFAMRDQSGREETRRFVLHSGDVLVMGGATQHHWEHAVPKCAHASPRMSLTTRAGWTPQPQPPPSPNRGL